MRRRSWPRCRRRPGWSTAGCSVPATTRGIGGGSPVPPRNLELAAGDPAGAPRAPAAGMTSHLRQRAGKWLARPRTQRSCGWLAPSGHPRGPGRCLVFGIARLVLAFRAGLVRMQTTTGRLEPRLTGCADVNGVPIYYEVYGDGSPLVLLHGGMLTIVLNFA